MQRSLGDREMRLKTRTLHASQLCHDHAAMLTVTTYNEETGLLTGSTNPTQFTILLASVRGGISHSVAAAAKAGAPQRVELVHGVEVGRRLLLALAAGQKIDACQVQASHQEAHEWAMPTCWRSAVSSSKGDSCA